MVVASSFGIYYNIFRGDLMGTNYGLKNRTRISNALDTNLYTKLQELSKTTQIPISKLLDNAVTMLLESYKDSNKATSN